MGKLLFLQNHDAEFLGPMYISAELKRAGHQCRLAVGRSVEDFRPVIEEYAPDALGLSVMTGGHLWALEIAGRLRQLTKAVIIMGGPHPTFCPGVAAHPNLDLAVRGEAEQAMIEIMGRIDTGQDFQGIANVLCRVDGVVVETPVRPLVEDLDLIAPADRSLYDVLGDKREVRVQRVITARGCPFDCAFCFQGSMRVLYAGKGRLMRVRRAATVIEECLRLKEEHKAEVIFFADDCFGVDRKWLYPFLENFRAKVGLPFVCLARADIIARDAEYAPRLAAAGCESVFFGIETGNERLRNEVLNKRLSNADIITAAEQLHQAGIRFRTYNIVGLPGETLEDALSTVDLNVRIQADYPWCSIFAPYPGTPLASEAVRLGFLPESFSEDDMTESFFVGSALDMPNIREMENLQKFFQTLVLWPWSRPLVRRLLGLRPNMLFSLWFGFVYFILYLRSERRSFWSTLRFALANARHVLK